MKPSPDINSARAIQVVERLDRAFQRQSGILAELSDLVEYQIPEGVGRLSLQHAQFLFYTVSNDHGMKSSRLYARAKELYDHEPRLFTPEFVVSRFDRASEALVEATGAYLGTRYPKQTAISWYENSVALLNRYGGDARKLYRCHSDASAVMRAICDFRSYGPKTGGLLLRAIVGLGFARVHKLDEVLLPVDVHDSRIAMYTGILHPIKEHSSLPSVVTVQHVLQHACKTVGIGWADVDRALWLIGSRGCVNVRCAECPLKDLCEKGRQVVGASLDL